MSTNNTFSKRPDLNRFQDTEFVLVLVNQVQTLYLLLNLI